MGGTRLSVQNGTSTSHGGFPYRSTDRKNIYSLNQLPLPGHGSNLTGPWLIGVMFPNVSSPLAQNSRATDSNGGK